MNCSKVTRVAIIERISLVDAYNALPRLHELITHRVRKTRSARSNVWQTIYLPLYSYGVLDEKVTNFKTRVNVRV